MLNPPTDRLHKFLAIFGLALVALGVSYPLAQYHAAELKRIEAWEQYRYFQASYQRYATLVNEQITAYNQMIKDRLTGEAADQVKRAILAKEPDIAALERETTGAEIQTGKQIELMHHYRFMRNVWGGLGIASVGIGLLLATVGFRQWLRQPRAQR